jgi:hypothetical protein
MKDYSKISPRIGPKIELGKPGMGPMGYPKTNE